MAKKGNRQLIQFQCAVCKRRNYISTKNVINTKDKMQLEKFCSFCRKETEHQETKISK